MSGAIRNAASPISSAKTPPGPKATSGPNTAILDDAREELDAARDHRLDDHRPADPLGGGSHGFGVGEVERDAAELGLVRARQRRS